MAAAFLLMIPMIDLRTRMSTPVPADSRRPSTRSGPSANCQETGRFSRPKPAPSPLEMGHSQAPEQTVRMNDRLEKLKGR